MAFRWLSFRCRLDADEQAPAGQDPEGQAPRGLHRRGGEGSEHQHPGLGPEHDLLIRGQDQDLGAGHVGTTEKAKSTAAQLVSAVEIR